MSVHGGGASSAHGTSESGDLRRYVSNHAIKLDDIVKFLFPAGVQHPNSPTRLFLLGAYGPLYAGMRLVFLCVYNVCRLCVSFIPPSL